MSRSWYPRLATPLEAAEVNLDGHYRQQWPPPGTTVIPVAHPEPWGLVVETDDALVDPDHAYWTTLENFLLGLGDLAPTILLRVAGAFTGPITSVVSVVGHWPVIWEANKGVTVRWIRSTIRGSLAGGVEQFQWKMDFGVPGDDPTLSETDAATYATDLAGFVAVSWAKTYTSGSPFSNFFPSTLALDEVGVVGMTQTTANGSDGTGGDATQDYPTAWHAYPIATQPKGTPVSGGFSLPLEVACAVTLQTDTRGPRGRGRCYLPAPTVTVMDVNGLFTGAFPLDCAKFVDDIADQVLTNKAHQLLVVSSRALQLHKVTSLQCGKVPDSQRRRRRNQDEARVVGATR